MKMELMFFGNKLLYVSIINKAFTLLTCSMFLLACSEKTAPASDLPSSDQTPGVAVLLVDTDRESGEVHEAIYGQFLEHINHSVVDGLYAEQIQGQGFEGKDFETHWEFFGESGLVSLAEVQFENGEKSLRLKSGASPVGIRQGRIYIQEGTEYNGSLWVKPEQGSPQLSFRIKDSAGSLISDILLEATGTTWQEVNYSFTSSTTETQAILELSLEGTGSVLIDFISLMGTDARETGMMRPDLVQSLKNLKPPFIRWPGGSFASIYKWKDGIGPQVSRKYNPNEIWGGYSDYYGFGTDEFMELCKQLETDPMIVLSATNIDPAQVEYAMDWVHYLIDPATTKWGKQRADNGHPAPYTIPYFQIDNEPMNHQLSPDEYAEIVNVFGSRLREIAPDSKIVACGQKRSNDLIWSKKLIDIAGDNFDILGNHNYEYENENFQTGVRRIEEYLVKVQDYVRKSTHPEIEVTVLEWGLCRSYDWRAGLHAAGSLISYEKIGIEMSCPALLMRNTTDNPEWRAFIYHDHVSWFPGSGYVVEKLFREHYAENQLASTSGTFKDMEDRNAFFDDISQMKPEDWRPGTIDAIATSSADGQRVVLKAVNYDGNKNTLLTRLQGVEIPEKAKVKVFTISAGLMDQPSLNEPDLIAPKESTVTYAKNMAFIMEPYSVIVVEIEME